MIEEHQRLVAPFYLRLMGTNAGLILEDGVWRPVDPERFGELAAVGRASTAAEVVRLLGDSWRPRVMGAWFSLFHYDDPRIGPAILQSLITSAGSLTAPALTTVASLLVGSASVPAMSAYLEHDLERDWGAAGFVAAAIEHLGHPSSRCVPKDRDLANFDRLSKFARRLYAARNGPDAP